jgi:hypothetical protein
VYAQELKLPFVSAVQDVETLPPSTVKVMVPCGTKPRPLTARPDHPLRQRARSGGLK